MPIDPHRLQKVQFHRQASSALAAIQERGDTVEQRAEALRAYWRVGELANQFLEEPGVLEPRLAERLAESVGRQLSWLDKTRQFARRYSTTELDELCKFAGDLGWKHVCYLLAVPDRKERARLQRQAAKEGWTGQELWERIRGPRKKADRTRGRLPKRPKNPIDALRQLENESLRWLKRSKHLLSEFQLALLKPPRNRVIDVGTARTALQMVQLQAEEAQRALDDYEGRPMMI